MKGANSGTRKDRLGNQIREVIAQVLLFEVKDPELSSVNVTDVELAGDLALAKVFYYGHNLTVQERAARQRALERARGFLRRRIGQEIHARTTPDLVFVYDDSVERASAIEESIRAARAHDQALAAELGSPYEEGAGAEGEGAEGGGAAQSDDRVARALASLKTPSMNRRKGVYSQSAWEELEGDEGGDESGDEGSSSEDDDGSWDDSSESGSWDDEDDNEDDNEGDDEGEGGGA